MSGAVVRTVLGDVPAADIGAIAFHEHLLFDLVRPAERTRIEDAEITMLTRWQVDYRSNENRNNARQLDRATAAVELGYFRDDGGSLIVDQSTHGLCRNADGLAQASRAADVHVVAAAGTYTADYIEPEVADLSVDGLTGRFVTEIEGGLDGTGVRAGLIGELGCSWPIRDVERRALCAAARAGKITGAAISVHPGRHRDGPFQIVEILAEAGADLSRVVICHMDRTYPRGERVPELLATGVNLEWDFFGIEQSHYRFGDVELPTDMQRLHLIKDLFRQGVGGRILVSQDICTRTRMTHLGGHGYGHLLRNVRPLMQRAGLSPTEIRQLLHDTPLRLLTLARQDRQEPAP